jgi:hypothetical protein
MREVARGLMGVGLVAEAATLPLQSVASMDEAYGSVVALGTEAIVRLPMATRAKLAQLMGSRLAMGGAGAVREAAQRRQAIVDAALGIGDE